MEIIGSAIAKVQNLNPSTWVWLESADSFIQVAEYPVITGQGVFVNLRGGLQIGPKFLDAAIEVAVWE